MSSGESFGGGEVGLGERSRDEERELGVRILNVVGEDELVSESDGSGPMVERVRGETDEGLNLAVFENVDMMAVLERTMKGAEKIDVNKLSNLRCELRENPEIGISYAEDYFAEVLDLSLRPWAEVDVNLGEDVLGDCANGGEYNDRIRVNLERHDGDVDSILVTLAHENWHSYQHDVMRRVRNGEDAVSEEMKKLAKLYEYNNRAYIRSDLDYEGYRKQLCEVEARTFGFFVGMKIGELKAKERERADFMAEYPEVYGEENLPGIEREVDGVLHGFNVGQFLKKCGVESLDRLWEVDEDEQLAQRYAGALSDLVGLEQPMDLEFVDRLENDKKARWSYKTGEVMVSRERMQDFRPLSKLPEIAWMMRQREIVRNDPESERGKAYKVNLGMYVRDDKRGHEMHKRQLLKRESDYFVDELLNILDEQATLEEIEGLTPEERASAEEERERLGWDPVVSQKYEVVGK